jgi:peptidylprolyl isomerase
MRRAAALAFLPLIAAAAIAGCSSSSSSSSSAAAADTNKSVTATGSFGKAPTVTIPAAKGTGPLYTKTVIQGAGATLTTSESLVGNFALYDWSGKTHKLLGSSYSEGAPTLFAGQLLPGLQKALIGQKMGSRVLAVMPPKDAYGTSGNSQIGVGASDTVIFVVDMIKEVSNASAATGKQVSNGGGALPTVTAGSPAKGPAITIPKTAIPKTLQVKTLIKGTGPAVKKGQLLVAQYTGENWRTKSVFDSSWSRSAPAGFVIGVGQVIPGWDKGLVGQTVGSRVLLVIPSADGYGTSGNSQAGINPTDTLVFVVDIIAAD